MTYNAAGQANAIGHTHLASKGFKVGDQVKHRKANFRTFHQIKDIHEDDGKVDLNPIDQTEGTANQSELTTIDAYTFLKEWSPNRSRIEILEACPKNNASNACLKAFTMRSMVASCMEELIKTNVVNGADLRIFTQPAVSVFALNNIDEQKLVLVPATKKLFTREVRHCCKECGCHCRCHELQFGAML